VKAHAITVATQEYSEAVVLDFVQPAIPCGRLGGWAEQAGFAKIGEGYPTQQHRDDS
jgi:hypothetical protein